MTSPYVGLPEGQWLAKTEELVGQHPLSLEAIRDVAVSTWGILWQTKIGEGNAAFRLDEVEIPATVIGYFFERLYARELVIHSPGNWRGGRSKEEKDIVCIGDPRFSIEMKTSGQLGTKIFGNRSYGQKAEGDAPASKPEKSGYYITVNFYGKALILIRFGWIDASDWKPQKSATGQAASLAPEVYKYKLIEVPGEYRLGAPVGVLKGVGTRMSEELAAKGVSTIYDLLSYEGRDKGILRFRELAENKFKPRPLLK